MSGGPHMYDKALHDEAPFNEIVLNLHSIGSSRDLLLHPRISMTRIFVLVPWSSGADSWILFMVSMWEDMDGCCCMGGMM
jgi:hypothetical protein